MRRMESSENGEEPYEQLLRRKLFRKPAYDPERIHIEPDLHWMDSAITPFTRTTAGVYDIANCRWYELSVERVVTDQAWIVGEVERHLSSPPNQRFNSISINENDEVTFAFKNDVSRPIYDMALYDGPIEKTTLDSIRKRKYLSCHIDTCEWDGKKVAYKCIEFPDDVKTILREIRVREPVGPDFPGVAPILTIVIDPDTQFVDGIVLPLYHTDVESFANGPRARLRISELHRLIHTLSHLHLLGIGHGDICERNVVLNVTCENTSEDIAPVDFGEVAPEYRGDFKMTAELLGWCSEHFVWTEREKRAVVSAAARIEEGDCGDALDILAAMF